MAEPSIKVGTNYGTYVGMKKEISKNNLTESQLGSVFTNNQRGISPDIPFRGLKQEAEYTRYFNKNGAHTFTASVTRMLDDKSPFEYVVSDIKNGISHRGVKKSSEGDCKFTEIIAKDCMAIDRNNNGIVDPDEIIMRKPQK